MSLTLSGIPGFTEVPDSAFANGATASDADLKAVNAAAKFAAVRGEQFWGFYKHGETVPFPTSPADGYVYDKTEVIFIPTLYWTGAPPAAALNGTQVTPSRGATSGEGLLLQQYVDVDPATGFVTSVMSYFKSSQQDRNDGIVRVVTLALRLR